MRHHCRTGTSLFGLIVLGGLSAGGCVARGNTEALETMLRNQEVRIESLERRLEETSEELTVARREVEHLRSHTGPAGQAHVAGDAGPTGNVMLASEQSDVLFRAEGVRINTLLTGGLDDDGRPGDDVLSVVLEPFDSDGQTIKLPGDVTLELIDPAGDGIGEAVGRWDYQAGEVRDLWHTGLFVTGFKFRLAWETPPRNETLVLHARLTTTDGRVFDTTETVTIHPAPPSPSPSVLP